MSSIADFVSSLRDHNARALDLLQLKRFRGKVGRGCPTVAAARESHPSEMSRCPGPRGLHWDR
jgi:hypothetical protein